MRILIRAVALTLTMPTLAAAQSNDAANPLSSHTKFMYTVLKDILVRSAEKMPEEHYAFKPAETVRSYGQIVGHVADMQYTFCSMALGEKNPAPRIEQTRTSKAELVGALKEALAYCDRAYDSMTDAAGVQIVKMGPNDTPRLQVLTVNSIHATEHYGNLVTYMRMKGLVPPTSEPGFRGQPRK